MSPDEERQCEAYYREFVTDAWWSDEGHPLYERRADAPKAPARLIEWLRTALGLRRRSDHDRGTRNAFPQPGPISVGTAPLGPLGSASEEVSPLPLTDLGNAERLIRQHGADVRYVPEWDAWAAYDGTRWARDATGAIARYAKATVRAMYAEAASIRSDSQRAELARWATRSESEPRLRAMISLARYEPGVATHLTAFDADPMLLNVRNGVLDLRTGELRQHERAELHTKLVPVAYDPDLPAPTWDAFLSQILPDPEVRACLQRAIGYSLTGDIREQLAFIVYGTGANGKSTLTETLGAVLADYAVQASMESFTLRHQGSGVPNDIARLAGRRFVVAQEAQENARLNEALVKSLTGGDRVQARFLHQEFFEFVPQFKLWLSTNHRPVIRGTDHAIWRRILLFPFTVTIPADRRNRKLPEKLRAELPGILAWAVRGCLEWQKRGGLDPPQAVQAATEEYRTEMDVIARFIEDCCVLHGDASAPAAALYKAYTEWAETNGERSVSQTLFGRQMGERGLTASRPRGVRHWAGIGLRAQEGNGDCDA